MELFSKTCLECVTVVFEVRGRVVSLILEEEDKNKTKKKISGTFPVDGGVGEHVGEIYTSVSWLFFSHLGDFSGLNVG